MRHNDRDYLFVGGDLWAVLDSNRQSVVAAVAQVAKDQFLSTSVDTLVEHIVARFVIEPLSVYEDQMQMEQHEARVEVTGRFDYDSGRGGKVYADGHQLNFHLPYSGDMSLWYLKPSSYFSVMPRGTVNQQASRLTITLVNTSNTEPERYKQELDSELQRIQHLIQSQREMLVGYHNELPTLVRGAIERRRNELEKLNGLAAFFDIPLVKKPGMPEFRPIEMAKKVPRPLPRAPASGYHPEPAISDEVYEEILGIIRHAGASFEGTPQTYMPLGEEGLRDNMLSHINVRFEGKATGETFRKYGKTDIRIEEEQRAAFVGECKLWGGEKVLVEALDQLLGYLTWRDSKAALIMFNKSVAGFTSVQQTISTSLPTHPNFLRGKTPTYAGEWRYVFRSAEDPSREVTVHIFAFNLYVAPERAGKKR